MNKKQTLEKCREILYNYKIGDIVNETDSLFLKDILNGHPAVKDKIGVGIKHFSIGKNFYKGQCFYLHRIKI